MQMQVPEWHARDDRGDNARIGELMEAQPRAGEMPGIGAASNADGMMERLRRRLDRHSTRNDVVQEIPPSSSRNAAFHPFSEAAQLRDLARNTVRAALRAEQRGGAAEGEVRMLLRQACDSAHLQDAHVERLLILLKEAWRELPQARHRTHNEAQAPLARVVTLCIEEFYATTPRRR